MPPKRIAECRLPIADCNRRVTKSERVAQVPRTSVGGLNFKGVVPDIGVSSGDQLREVEAGNVGRLRPAF